MMGTGVKENRCRRLAVRRCARKSDQLSVCGSDRDQFILDFGLKDGLMKGAGGDSDLYLRYLIF